MIKMKDLMRRKYDGSKCIGFEYEVKGHDGNELLCLKFSKPKVNVAQEPTGEVWKVTTLNDHANVIQAYNIAYEMPHENLPLELIAATGIRYLYMELNDEIKYKELVCQGMREALGGM